MLWRLALLILATVMIVLLVVWPVGSVSVKIELPEGVAESEADQAAGAVLGVANFIGYAVVGMVVSAAVWIGLRIVRRYGHED